MITEKEVKAALELELHGMDGWFTVSEKHIDQIIINFKSLGLVKLAENEQLKGSVRDRALGEWHSLEEV